MITKEQIKAARALLNWNQQKLAEATSISKTAIANIERGQASPRIASLKSIKKALEDGGVEFVDGPGVRLKKDVVQVEILSGEDSLSKLWEDIYDTLKNGQERLIYGVDEDKFTHSMGRGFFIMMSKYKEKNIKGRILSMEGDDNFADPSSEYRWIKKEHFGDVPYYVYGNKYAMLLWEPEPPTVVLIENKVIADNFRNQFERHWQKAIIPE